MEPVVMAISHTSATFDVTLPVFIPQLLSSRSNTLNSQAQARALAREETELESLQDQINSEPINSQFEIFGDNKELIEHLNQKIAELFKKKLERIHWYACTVLKESLVIVGGEKLEPELFDKWLDHKREIEREIKFYDSELEHLQRRRVNLWDANTSLHDRLLSQEKKYNGKLDASFQRYSGLLEKIYLRNNKNNDRKEDKKILKKLITTSQFLIADFNNSSQDISYNQTREIKARFAVAEIENAINGEESRPYLDPLNKDLAENHCKNHLVAPTL